MTADHPDNLNEMLSVIAEAMADGTPLSVSGCASKSDWGYAIADARPVSVDRWAGIIDYQPDELILTVRAGTPMTEINKTLANKNQMLGFEPPDPSVLFAKTDLSNKGSIGGVLATNSSGSRRLTAGVGNAYTNMTNQPLRWLKGTALAVPLCSCVQRISRLLLMTRCSPCLK